MLFVSMLFASRLAASILNASKLFASIAVCIGRTSCRVTLVCTAQDAALWRLCGTLLCGVRLGDSVRVRREALISCKF